MSEYTREEMLETERKYKEEFYAKIARDEDPLGYPEQVTLEVLIAEVVKLRERVNQLESREAQRVEDEWYRNKGDDV